MCRFPHLLPLILPSPLVPLVRSAGPLVPLVRSAGPLVPLVRWFRWSVGSAGPLGDRSGDNFAIGSKRCYTGPEKFDRHFGPPGRQIFTARSGDNFAIDSKTCYTDPKKFDRHFGPPGHKIFTVRRETDREITSPLGQKLVIRTRESLTDYPNRSNRREPPSLTLLGEKPGRPLRPPIRMVDPSGLQSAWYLQHLSSSGRCCLLEMHGFACPQTYNVVGVSLLPQNTTAQVLGAELGLGRFGLWVRPGRGWAVPNGPRQRQPQSQSPIEGAERPAQGAAQAAAPDIRCSAAQTVEGSAGTHRRQPQSQSLLRTVTGRGTHAAQNGHARAGLGALLKASLSRFDLWATIASIKFCSACTSFSIVVARSASSFPPLASAAFLAASCAAAKRPAAVP
jgi:hypothetical protein